MKLAAAFFLGAAITATSTVNADQSTDPTPVVIHSPAVATSTTPVYTRSRRYVAPSRSPLAQLMELERRKNAWLRRTFLGRR